MGRDHGGGSSTEPGDGALVRRARAGDRGAFAALVARHYGLVLRLCRRVVGPVAAEDAAQEAVLAAMLQLDRLRDGERFGPWLAGIGLNLCRVWLREQARRAPIEPEDSTPDDLWSSDLPDPAEAAAAAEAEARVRRAIAALPPGQRAAVVLHYLRGMSQPEAAAALGVELGAVKTRLHKARGTLRRALGTEEIVATEPSRGKRRAIEVVLEQTRVNLKTGMRVAVLAEKGGDRVLPIWMNPQDGDGLALHLQQLETPRPTTYDSAVALVRAGGVRVRGVTVERLVDDVFYATVALDGAAGSATIDARPSDAINLAVRAGAPIRVRAELFERAGKTRELLAEWDARGAEPAPDPERLTPAAARVLARAREEEPRRFNHRWVGTEHLLLALVREGSGVAASVLGAAGVTVAKVERQFLRGKEPQPQPPALTPGAARALRDAEAEASQRGHDAVGTGHLLLAVLRNTEGYGFRILGQLRADPDELRAAVEQAFARGDEVPPEP